MRKQRFIAVGMIVVMLLSNCYTVSAENVSRRGQETVGANTEMSVWDAVLEEQENPIAEPVTEPTVEPTAEPTTEPVTQPTVEPIPETTEETKAEPTVIPTIEPEEKITVFNTEENSQNPVIQVQDMSGEQKDFQITLSSFRTSAEVVSIQAAVWSQNNGQDDLHWVTLTQTDEAFFEGNIHVADFSSVGHYFSHVYVRNANNSMTFLGGAEFDVDGVKSEGCSVSGLAKGKSTLFLRGAYAPSGIASVRAAVWYTANPNTMYWYPATLNQNNEYEVQMDVKNHQFYAGEYTAHFYSIDGNGFQQFTNGMHFNLEEQSAQLACDLSSDYKSCEIYTDLSTYVGGIKDIRTAIWSEMKGQDDLTWVSLKYMDSMFYTQTDLTRLKDYGTCFAHTYLETMDGSMHYLGGKIMEIPQPSCQEITAVTQENGAFTVEVNGVSALTGIQEVRCAVWSNPNQNDLVWYTAAQIESGKFQITSDISRHRYNVGQYYAHMYLKDGNNRMIYLKGTSFKINYSAGSVNASEVLGHGANYHLTIENVQIPGNPEVRFAVWSAAGGQDDINWYAAERAGTTYSTYMDILSHRSFGKYYVHAYARTRGGTMIYLGGTDKVNISQPRSAGLSTTLYFQYPELPTGCESVALTMGLNVFGFGLDKSTIARNYLVHNSSNFAIGFVGDPFGQGMGVFPPGLVTTANNFLSSRNSGYSARDISGNNFESLFSYIAYGSPVMLWVTGDYAAPRFKPSVCTYNGKQYHWYGNEHCVLLQGYNLNNHTVTIYDSISGVVTLDISVAANVYNSCGKYAMTIY